MARSRKPVEDVEMDLDAEVDEATELELDSDEEVEAVEASEDSDEEADEETKAPVAKKAPRKPRVRKPRAPRKPKEPVASMLESMSSDEEPTEPVAELEEKVEKRAKPVLTREPEVKIDLSNDGNTVREDVAIASVSIHKSMDNMAKQWGTVKEISSSVCANLERVNTMLKEVPTQDLFKPQIARPAAITKIAVGFSAAAFVLSAVSLLLSQSARQASFERAQFGAPSAKPAAVARVARPARPTELALTDPAAAKDPIAALIAPSFESAPKKAAPRRSRTQRPTKRKSR